MRTNHSSQWRGSGLRQACSCLAGLACLRLLPAHRWLPIPWTFSLLGNGPVEVVEPAVQGEHDHGDVPQPPACA